LANQESVAAWQRVAGSRPSSNSFFCFSAILILLLAAFPLEGRRKDAVDYGAGLVVNIPLTESEVVQVVNDVVQNGIIRGSVEYSKDEYISGATAVASTPLFPQWTEGGRVFYKVRKQVVDPLNFKDSGDLGTLAVRYVVQPQGETNTVLRIDAVFVEEFRHRAHASNGSVEGAEYKSIQDHLDAIELMKKQAVEAEVDRQERLAKKKFAMSNEAATVTPSPPAVPLQASKAAEPESLAMAPGETLEQHVADLRRRVERIVKIPGAPLKSAPFHSANTLKSLPSGTEVLIVISTPYWFGVETHDGQHGWIPRDQLEQLP
jgi:uncharacterized protein YegP (UPF0339 family)